MERFSGVWPALVTPLKEDGSINVACVEALIEDFVAAGVGGIYVGGSTGEGVLLSVCQRKAIAEASIKAAAGRIPVMIHVGTADTATAVELAAHASKAGATAVSAVPPFYYQHGFKQSKAHYAAIIAASSVPMYAYHIPSATGTNMTEHEILELCAMDGVAGFKYTSQDLTVLERVLALRDPEKVNVMSGPDPLFLATYALGVDGCIGTTYNFQPRCYIDIKGAFDAGDLALARKLQRTASNIIEVLRKYGVMPGTKAALNLQGYDAGFCVPPFQRVEGATLDAFARDVDAAGLGWLRERACIYGPADDPMRGRLG